LADAVLFSDLFICESGSRDAEETGGFDLEYLDEMGNEVGE
jgi:hypothetical protein